MKPTCCILGRCMELWALPVALSWQLKSEREVSVFEQSQLALLPVECMQPIDSCHGVQSLRALALWPALEWRATRP